MFNCGGPVDQWEAYHWAILIWVGGYEGESSQGERVEPGMGSRFVLRVMAGRSRGRDYQGAGCLGLLEGIEGESSSYTLFGKIVIRLFGML